MLSVNMSNNLHELLNEVRGHFEENLKQNVMDQWSREYRRHEGYPNHKFDIPSTFIPVDNVNIELKNLRITEESACVLNTFLLDLEMFNITLQVNIKQLKIFGEYNHSTVGTLNPVSKSGNVTFTLDDTTFDVNIGIAIEEDSFITKNFDINFKPARILTEINVQNEIQETSSADIDETFIKYLSAQLRTFCRWEILHRPLSGNIVEYSVSELLIDEPEEMIAISAERTLKANQMLDSLLSTMNEFFKTSNQTILETPPINTCILHGGIHENFQTDKGQLQDVSTFVRSNDISFYEQKGVQYLYGLIKLSTFKLKYTSCKINENEKGIMEVEIGRGNVFVKLALTADENSVNITVHKVQASDIRDVHLDIDDNLNSYSEQLHTLVIGSLYSMVFPLLEQKITEGIQYSIQNRKI